jgi:hypothetical protein
VGREGWDTSGALRRLKLLVSLAEAVADKAV